jgi:hypothetical protein
MKQKPECKIMANGSKWWKLDGIVHREDGPAFESADGYRCWFKHGKRHREDGPAAESKYGAMEWWVNDQRLYPEAMSNNFMKKLKKKYPKLVEAMMVYLVHES